jgi:hypothetical protein
MRVVLPFLFLLLTAAPPVMAGDQSLADLQQVNALLQAEYDLAKSGKPYLVINLQEHQLEFKTSGLPLEQWGVDSYRRWGHPAAMHPASLEIKSSLAEPEREVHVVSATEPSGEMAEKPFKALELADMPASYRLHLDNGTTITVHPVPVSWFDYLRNSLVVPAWYLSRPLISSWNFLRGSPYNELALAMPAQDARRLYWAFSEGTPCLIRLPAAEAAASAPAPAGTNR